MTTVRQICGLKEALAKSRPVKTQAKKALAETQTIGTMMLYKNWICLFNQIVLKMVTQVIGTMKLYKRWICLFNLIALKVGMEEQNPWDVMFTISRLICLGI